MKRIALFTFSLLLLTGLNAQRGPAAIPNIYRASAPKINDLVHTKLDAKLDFSRSQLQGKVWITLKPHFYPTDSLQLDAKGMDIKKVALSRGGKNSDLKYDYDGLMLDIQLDKTYRNNEQYTVYIEYTSKPDEFKVAGSAAITDAKGLYFINPKGEEPGKPTQVWTQGETEATSVWVPTIDKPNQKTTEEISMTVPSKFVTLSNGKLVSQTKNADGTRTDHWKMDLPHAPYLFFMGAGDFAVVKDSYKGKEVSYYVDKEYASVARKIFGLTPEMIAFFSKATGVDYPWVKYGQMTAHDYVSGAMENTTATLHSDAAQQDARQLVDGNGWEDVISHELFHQWFGDYVTTESWSNLTLNESFANYSEYLWREYKYGKDYADEHNYNDMSGYLHSRSADKDLVRFYYGDKEDMFDAVSYNKGGRILHMLRNFVGDSAFFKALNLYLVTNKFKSAEAHQLRLAFEEVTGKDLNWFFNQWYFGGGNPDLNIKYSYDENSKKAQVIVEQTQAGDKLFSMPVKIDVWNGNKSVRYNVWFSRKTDTFSFPAFAKPDLINFDADKTLLANKTENKTLPEYVYQYRHANNYLDKREALDYALKNQSDPAAAQLIATAIKDPYWSLRNYAVNRLELSAGNMKSLVEASLYEMAQKEKYRMVKAAAISKLGSYKSPQYIPLFKTAVNDSSYSVSGSALDALYKVDSVVGVNEAKRLSAVPTKGRLQSTIKAILSAGNGADAIAMINDFEKMPLSQEKFQKLGELFDFIQSTSNTELFKKAVDAVFNFEKQIPDQFKEQVIPAVNAGFKEIAKEKADNGLKEHADYIESKLPKEKGF